MIKLQVIFTYIFILILVVVCGISSGTCQHINLFGEPVFVSHIISSSNDSLSEKAIIDKIRDATKEFMIPENARSAGYRPLGPDMPNMGIHWINTGLAVQRTIDFEKPSTLTYLSVDGELKLTGVAYTTPVNSGEKAPKLPFENMSWHYHSGNLEKEAHGVHNEHMQRDQEVEMNLAMLHVWVWAENPEGVFSPDNWALSFLRFGLIPPKDIDPNVSKALFLASGNVDYYIKFIELSVEPEIIDLNLIRSIIQEYSSRINNSLELNVHDRTVHQNLQVKISDIWQDMWAQIESELSPEEWEKIEVNINGHNHHK